MKRILVSVLSVAGLLICMPMGICASAGVCALFYGPRILETALGDPPDRAHPAYILFLALMVPGMLLGACGCVFGIVIPLHLRFGVPFRESKAGHSWLHGYALKLAALTEPESLPESPDPPAGKDLRR